MDVYIQEGQDVVADDDLVLHLVKESGGSGLRFCVS
jgi:hypothetical protein